MNQRISVLLAATSDYNNSESATTNEELIESVKYELISSVLRLCCASKDSARATIFANSSTFLRRRWHRNHRTPQQIAELKKVTRCKNCGQWGHWHSGHLPNGTFKSGVRTFRTPANKVKAFRNKPQNYIPRRKSMTYNMVNMTVIRKLSTNHFIGPLLEDGTPNSGLLIHELKILSPYLRTTWHGKLDPLPAAIADRIHWQYGSGSHWSYSRRMLVSIVISARIKMELTRHIVIAGSLQWLIGRNVTSKCDLIHTNWNYPKLSNQKVVPLQNVDMHSYIPLYIFLNNTNNKFSNFQAKLFCATGCIGESTNASRWSELKRIIH